MHRRRVVSLAMTAVLFWSAAADGARPQSWTFAMQKDFFQGRFENVVVDSYGELTLGRALAPIPAEEAGESVQGFAQTPDGSIYVATSPSAKVFRIREGKTEVVYAAPKGFDDITAMAGDGKGNLLIALSGESAKLISLNPAGDKPAPVTRFENKDVDYIWAIAPASDGAIYLGTGPHGKVYKLAGDAEPEVLLETGQKNVTALALDKSNNVIAGTDAHGLVIRVDAATKKPFVLLDAGKLDINALVADANGNLYVATAKAQFSDQNAKESGGPDRESMDEPDTRSKPAAPEREPIDPPPPADDAGKGPATQGAGPAPPGYPLFLGAAGSDLPADLKAMLKKATAQSARMAHAPKGKTGTLPSHASQPRGKAMSLDETPSTDDVSGVTRIAPDGVITTLVQDQGDNYALLLVGDELLIGTGDEGKLYSYHLHDESLSLIARVKEQQISNLFADKSGAIFLGTGNMAEIYELGASRALKGAFTSQVLDAAHTASWGHAIVDSTAPAATRVLIESRSGNTQDVRGNPKFWSDWAAAGEGSKIVSPAARFLQFRVTLSADGSGPTPVVSNLRVAYQTTNLAPKVKNVTLDMPGVASPDDSGDSMTLSDDTSPATEKLAHVSWDAADPNGDTLLYRLYYKQITPEGKEPWTLLARDLKDAIYEWDTRSIPDGKYQVKVVASDSPDNPAPDALECARASVPFIINHTPPAMSDLASAVDGNKATVTGNAKDVLSPVADVRYQVDGNIAGGSGEDWQPAAASDKIFDSPQEAFTLVTRPLSAGPHRITIRATDAAGNSSYKAVTVIVKP